MNITPRTCANCAALYINPKRKNPAPECGNGIGGVDLGDCCEHHETKQEYRDDMALIEELRETGGTALVIKCFSGVRVSRAAIRLAQVTRP